MTNCASLGSFHGSVASFQLRWSISGGLKLMQLNSYRLSYRLDTMMRDAGDNMV